MVIMTVLFIFENNWAKNVQSFRCYLLF
uniref:Uncharacterized protein n=1 Tax=Anguilla anguilla TaxID=7936 RepID=A0A0E9RD43_ANGAN